MLLLRVRVRENIFDVDVHDPSASLADVVCDNTANGVKTNGANTVATNLNVASTTWKKIATDPNFVTCLCLDFVKNPNLDNWGVANNSCTRIVQIEIVYPCALSAKLKRYPLRISSFDKIRPESLLEHFDRKSALREHFDFFRSSSSHLLKLN